MVTTAEGLPPANWPISDGDGSISKPWYNYLKGFDKLGRESASLISTATTYAQSILAATTASVARTALGLGTAATANLTVGGSWTPELTVGGATGQIGMAVNVGRYVKMGQHVHLYCHIRVNNTGASTGLLSVTGYASVAGTPATVSDLTIAGAFAHLAGTVPGNPSAILVTTLPTSFTFASTPNGSINTSQISTGTDFAVSISYYTT